MSIVRRGFAALFVLVLALGSFALAQMTYNESPMLAELVAAPLLQGARGAPPRDLDALVALICKVSDYVAATGAVEELDLNPVWVGAEGEGAFALDAVIVERVR